MLNCLQMPCAAVLWTLQPPDGQQLQLQPQPQHAAAAAAAAASSERRSTIVLLAIANEPPVMAVAGRVLSGCPALAWESYVEQQR